MADRKQGAGLSSGSSAAVHKVKFIRPQISLKICKNYNILCHHQIDAVYVFYFIFLTSKRLFSLILKTSLFRFWFAFLFGVKLLIISKH